MLNNFWKSVKAYIRHLYLNYLLITELYMVEDWEKIIIHIVFALLFALFWYFNYSIIFTAVREFRRTTPKIEELM